MSTPAELTEFAEQALSLRLKVARHEARRVMADLEAVGVYVTYVPTTGELCPNCTAHYATERSGFCVRCTTEMDLERQRIEDGEERERLEKEATKDRNVVKKQRQRMREEFDANPRKKT